MRLFRNPEVRKLLAYYLMASGLLFAFLYANGFSHVLPFTALICLFFAGINFWFFTMRYRTIEKMAMDLDSVLHGNDSIDFEQYEEGELSILKNEIDKVLIRLREQSDALQAEKIYLTDSIADISHQLRTPLTSINLLIDFLKQEDISQEKRMQLAADLQRFSNRIDWLINALLKISKIDAGTANFKQERVEVGELLKKALAPLEIHMDLRDQHLVTHCQGTEFFTGDMAWMAEALGNILKNCSEHTPVGGTIEIVCEQTVVHTQIIIKDNGPGINLEDLPHLFERFYKGRNSSEASIGIGLALARMIITNQNGIIKAENNPSGGAKFTIKMYHTII